MLHDDGDYLSSQTPTKKASLRTKEELWQAIETVKLSRPLVNDDEMPRATEEQARVQTGQIIC